MCEKKTKLKSGHTAESETEAAEMTSEQKVKPVPEKELGKKEREKKSRNKKKATDPVEQWEVHMPTYHICSLSKGLVDLL